MRFLVDAQLPARLARVLSSAGYDALHDAIVAALAEADFVEIGPSSLVVHRRREGGPTG